MRALRILGWTIVGLSALLLTLFGLIQTAPGKRVLAGLVSSPTLEVTGISGFVPTDMQIARIEMKDRQGAWLTVDDARLSWSFASLFTGRLLVETVTARQADVLRPPRPSEETPPPSSSDGISLPVGVDLRALAIDDLHVGAPLGGVDSHWKLGGSALLAADRTQSRLKLDMNRTDGPAAKLAADLGFTLDRFTIDGTISAEESAKGGVIAALIGRPDLERDSLKLTAKGDRGNGTAELTVAAGDAVSSTGSAQWHRISGATAFQLKVTAAAPGLPDSPIARLLHDPATLIGDGTLDDAGVLVVRSLALAVGPLNVEAGARYDSASDKLNALTTITTGEAGPLADLAGGITWRNLRLEARTELSGLAKTPQGTVTLNGSADDMAAASLDGKAPPPGHVDLAAVIGLEPDGRIVIRSLDTSSPLVGLKASGGYLPSRQAGDAKLSLDLRDFAPLSNLAGLPLGGRAHLDLTLATRPEGARVDWQSTLDDLSLPNLPVGLQRQTVRLSGGVALQKDRSWKLDAVKLATDGLTLDMAGSGRDRTGTIDLGLDLPRLGLLQQEVSGSASAKARVTLKPAGGDMHFTVDLADLARGGITSRKLALVLDTSLEGEAAKGSVKADGDLANQPLTLAGSFARNADGGVLVPSLQGSWASGSVDVRDLAVTPKGATGSGHLKMGKLADLAPLIGTDLAGALDLDITTEPDPAGKVTVALRGDKIRAGATGVGSLQLDATVTDPIGVAATEATIKADRLSGAADLSQASATVKGDRKGFDVTLKVAGAVTNANLAARIEPAAEEIRVALQRLDARYQGIPVALNAPARFKVMGSRVTIEPVSLRVGGGRVTVNGTVDQAAGDLTVDIAGLPLALVDSFAPGTGLEGTLQAKAHVTDALANPTVQASYSASGVRIKRPETTLLPSLALKGTASMANRQATADASVSAGNGTQLGIKGKAAIPQGNAPLNATVALSGAMDVAPFAPAAGTSVRGIAGTLRPNLTITLNGERMTGSGTVAFTGGALYLPDSGMRLTGGQATLSLQGETLQLDKLSFQTARSGEISATGTVRLDPAQGFPVDLTVTTRKALVANRPDILATVSSDIKITGSNTNGLDVTGPVTIDRAEIGIGVSQAANYPTLQVREINGGAPDPTAPKPPPPQPKGKVAPKEPQGVRLALTINAPQAVFVRGRGLDAEVGGKFTVSGNPEAPAVLGALTLRRGTLTLVGHRLDFTRGNVSLANVNEIDPELDFAATTTVESTTIEVDITGTSRVPKIALTSSPSLPQDEAMAMLLFGKPSASLSPTELLSAAQALSEFTGGTPVGGGFFGRLRQSIGLDQLSVNSSSSSSSSSSGSGSPSLQGGRYVSPGVYVGAEQGASGDSSRGVVEIEVFKHTKVTGAIGTDSNDKIGAKMEWDY